MINLINRCLVLSLMSKDNNDVSDKDLDKDVSDNDVSKDGFLLEQDKLNCIGCGACVAVAPDFWVFDNDGKVSIIDGKVRDDGWLEKIIEKKDVKQNVEAAESCPVNIIHLKSLKDDKKLV